MQSPNVSFQPKFNHPIDDCIDSAIASLEALLKARKTKKGVQQRPGNIDGRTLLRPFHPSAAGHIKQ